MATDQRGAAAFRAEPMASSFGRVLLGSGPDETPATRLPPGTLLRDVLAESGAVLLRDFGLTVSDFDDFTLDPGDRFLVHPGTVNGGRENVTATTATVDSGVLPFPWHRELGYAPSPPDLVLFSVNDPRARVLPLRSACASRPRSTAAGDTRRRSSASVGMSPGSA